MRPALVLAALGLLAAPVAAALPLPAEVRFEDDHLFVDAPLLALHGEATAEPYGEACGQPGSSRIVQACLAAAPGGMPVEAKFRCFTGIPNCVLEQSGPGGRDWGACALFGTGVTSLAWCYLFGTTGVPHWALCTGAALPRPMAYCVAQAAAAGAGVMPLCLAYGDRLDLEEPTTGVGAACLVRIGGPVPSTDLGAAAAASAGPTGEGMVQGCALAGPSNEGQHCAGAARVDGYGTCLVVMTFSDIIWRPCLDL